MVMGTLIQVVKKQQNIRQDVKKKGTAILLDILLNVSMGRTLGAKDNAACKTSLNEMVWDISNPQDKDLSPSRSSIGRDSQRAQYSIELHIHLDGAPRTSSILEMAKKRGIELPTYNVDDLKKYVTAVGCTSLTAFLQTFQVYMPAIVGDEECIRRIALEFCEDSAAQGVIYSEVRYSPHLLASCVNEPVFCKPGSLTPERVVECVNEGLKEGQETFNIKVRSILCCIRNRPDWSKDVLNLCIKYRDDGVVGIDLAGDETFANPSHREHISAFEEAKRLGIHRTVHAGENGGAENVLEAIDIMHAQRIGHGYHVLQRPDIYQKALSLGIHFETCPHSSFVTGSVPVKPENHPVIRFAKDGANFCVSTDDPTVVGKNLQENYDLLLNEMNFTSDELMKCNLNAAEASFLPDNEKSDLLKYLKNIYNVV